MRPSETAPASPAPTPGRGRARRFRRATAELAHRRDDDDPVGEATRFEVAEEASSAVDTSGTSGTTGTIRSVSTRSRSTSPFALTHQFKAREARDHFKELMDRAENGGVAVLRRNSAMVLVDRDLFDSALAAKHPFDVKVNLADGQTSMWMDGIPVHGVGDSYDEAEEDFLNALVDYAEAWIQELRFAPNHRANGGLVERVLMYAGERDELRRVVFGDE